MRENTFRGTTRTTSFASHKEMKRSDLTTLADRVPTGSLHERALTLQTELLARTKVTYTSSLLSLGKKDRLLDLNRWTSLNNLNNFYQQSISTCIRGLTCSVSGLRVVKYCRNYRKTLITLHQKNQIAAGKQQTNLLSTPILLSF